MDLPSEISVENKSPKLACFHFICRGRGSMGGGQLCIYRVGAGTQAWCFQVTWGALYKIRGSSVSWLAFRETWQQGMEPQEGGRLLLKWKKATSWLIRSAVINLKQPFGPRNHSSPLSQALILSLIHTPWTFTFHSIIRGQPRGWRGVCSWSALDTCQLVYR